MVKLNNKTIKIINHGKKRLYEVPKVIKFTHTQPETVVKLIEEIKGTVGESPQKDIISILQDYSTKNVRNIREQDIMVGLEIYSKIDQLVSINYNRGTADILKDDNFIIDSIGETVILISPRGDKYIKMPITRDQLINNFKKL